MSTVLRRETFIALRASRQAHRIASAIINPPVPISTGDPRDSSQIIQENEWTKKNRPPPPPKWLVILLIVFDLAVIALVLLLLRAK